MCDTVFRFSLSGSPSIYQYHNESLPVRNKVRLVSISPLLAAKSQFCAKVNEIVSLKTEKSPGIILEKSWSFVFLFLYEPCGIVSQLDKHNCIDFHRVNCNEPTPLLLNNF